MFRDICRVHHLFGLEQRSRWVALVALVALTTVAEAAATLLVFLLVAVLAAGSPDLPLVGEVTLGGDSTLPFAAGVAVFFAMRGLLVVVQDAVLYRLCYGAGARLEEELLLGYLQLPPAEAGRRGRAQLVRNVHDTVITVVEGALIPLVRGTGLLLRAAAIAAVMVVTAPQPALLAVAVFAPALWLLVRALRGPLRRVGEEVEASLEESLRRATETLDLAPEVALAGRAPAFARRFAAVRERLAAAAGTEEVLRGVPRVVGESLLVLFVVCYLALSASRGLTEEVLPTLALFAYSALRLLPSVLSVVAMVNSLRVTGPALETVVSDVRLVRALAGPRGPGLRVAEVALRGVVVCHPGAPAPALDGVDLTLRRGDVVSVLGANGAGKSTLVELLAGLREPDAGEVLLDGRRRTEPLDVALVAQHVRLLDASIPGNVTLDADLDAEGERRLARVLDEAGLRPVIDRLPHGVDGSVGEGGAALSGGERQRVALARAAFRDASVLLYDEATSALDADSRRALADLVLRSRHGRITVVVTHDEELARRCTRAVLLDRGRVVADATPAEVLGARVSLSA